MQLTKRDKAEAKIILSLLVVGLLLEGVNNESGGKDSNPAVSQITHYIDELLEHHEDAERRNTIINKVQKTRVKLTQRVKDIDKGSALIGAMRHLTTMNVKVAQGTRLDFIISTFAKNLKTIEEGIPYNAEKSRKFEIAMRGVVNSI